MWQHSLDREVTNYRRQGPDCPQQDPEPAQGGTGVAGRSLPGRSSPKNFPESPASLAGHECAVGSPKHTVRPIGRVRTPVIARNDHEDHVTCSHRSHPRGLRPPRRAFLTPHWERLLRRRRRAPHRRCPDPAEDSPEEADQPGPGSGGDEDIQAIPPGLGAAGSHRAVPRTHLCAVLLERLHPLPGAGTAAARGSIRRPDGAGERASDSAPSAADLEETAMDFGRPRSGLCGCPAGVGGSPLHRHRPQACPPPERRAGGAGRGQEGGASGGWQ